MFIQLPDLEGRSAWFNTDYVVSVHPAGRDPTKTVLVFHDGKSITIDRDCQKVVLQLTAGDRPQFPFPALPAKSPPNQKPHPLSLERASSIQRRHQRQPLLPPASA
jgi:hypothetical protein